MKWLMDRVDKLIEVCRRASERGRSRVKLERPKGGSVNFRYFIL